MLLFNEPYIARQWWACLRILAGRRLASLATFRATVSTDLAADDPDFIPIFKTSRASYACNLWVVSLATYLIMEPPTGICTMPGT